ncbi:RNA-binding protein Pasilla-like [Cylas formicarius]|uniref:RNA-binding protein Pasilla-like n=1 Tax=Cylas formicarius TaxID=197179 RepID=UPI0029588F54|nr:RNA-binding protein Pasilla-like [Cylas formicarius]
MASDSLKFEPNRRGFNEKEGSRKRRISQNSDTGGKRKQFNGDEDDGYNFKMLVPNGVAGAIIGKGGETIERIQKDSGARVLVSKSHDFYPGTNERICLVTGNRESILNIIDFVLEKVCEKSSENQRDNGEGSQIKIVIPNSTAGMIIGKGGSYIRQIKEESGCSFVQVSHKNNDMNLHERYVTIVGNYDEMKHACDLVLGKIMEDPQSTNYTNVSYNNFDRPPSGHNHNQRPPDGPPFNSMGPMQQMQMNKPMNNSGVNLSINLNSAGSNSTLGGLSQLLDQIKMQLKGCGLTELEVMEVCAALTVLAKYGILGLGGLSIANITDLLSQRGDNRMFGTLEKIIQDCLMTKPAPFGGGSGPDRSQPFGPGPNRFGPNSSMNRGGNFRRK